MMRGREAVMMCGSDEALNLKTCCIVLGKASGDFLRCKEGFDRYDAEIKKVTAVVADAQAARQEGKTEVVDQKIAEAKESVKAAEASAEKFEKQVAEIRGTGKRADGGQEEKAAASDCWSKSPAACASGSATTMCWRSWIVSVRTSASRACAATNSAS